MTDQHLLNMLDTVVGWAEKATAEFRAIVEQAEEHEAQIAFSSKPFTEAQRKIYGLLPPPDIEETTTRYAMAIAQFSLRIEPYLLEALERRSPKGSTKKRSSLCVSAGSRPLAGTGRCHIRSAR